MSTASSRLQLKHKATRSKFRDLIDTLRTRTLLKDQISPAHLPIISQHSLQPHYADILPVTQEKENQVILKHEVQLGGEDGLDLSQIEESISETEQESAREEAIVNQITDLLRPQAKLAVPKNEGRSGCIRHQRFALNKHARPIQPRYIKVPRQQPLPIADDVALLPERIPLKNIDEMEMIKYWNTAGRINENTTAQAISEIFGNLIEELSISITNPTIKKYKNCVYFGSLPTNNLYEGIIYYFDHKIYYGELTNGNKNGYGVEIDFNKAITFAGNFQNGKKNGPFFVQKQRENYEGELLHGLYHGNGKLMTEDCIYIGTFENGKKHGFGEQFYPKTGLLLKGCFKNGEYQHLDKAKALPDPTSEVQLKNKPQKVIVKSNSYDIDFQLQKTFKKQVEGLNKPPKDGPLLQDDSKSLFDIASNTVKPNKYDYSFENVSRFPKIRIQGIQTRFKQSNPELDIGYVNHQKEFEMPIHRRYHSQQQKSIVSSNVNSTDLEEPLLKHRLNTPIHRIK